MRTYDLSPLYRATVGFDHLFNTLDRVTADSVNASYPPYNIERTDENAYRISVAVAGFNDDELDVEVKENTLTISGKKQSSEDEEGRKFLHRGIAARSFTRKFELADNVEVRGAGLENGLLNIDLVREIPEEQKPRRIEIASSGTKTIEGKKAA